MNTIEKHISFTLLLKDAIDILCLITVATLIGLTINQLRDKPLPLVYESKMLRLERAVDNLAASANTQNPNTAHVALPHAITLDQLQQFIKEKSGVVFDARPEIFHRLGHIPGAYSLPREDFENSYKTFQPKLEQDRSQPIIVYCSGSSCEDSTLVQKSLQALGYTNVAVFSGGWSEWQDKGLPVEAKE